MIKIEITGDKEDEVLTLDGNPVRFTMEKMKFKTGNTGFFAFGKVSVNGVKHQATLNLAKVREKTEKK